MDERGTIFVADTDCPTCGQTFATLSSNFDGTYEVSCGAGHHFPARPKSDPEGGDEIRFEYRSVTAT